MLKQQQGTMQAKDLMRREVVTVREETTVADLADLLQESHIHGAPVVVDGGQLVGFVSLEDILFGTMGGPASGPEQDDYVARVEDIMTAPAVSATEETDIKDLCNLMWRLRVHHVPIVRDGKVTGIVSSLDLCRVIADGEFPA